MTDLNKGHGNISGPRIERRLICVLKLASRKLEKSRAPLTALEHLVLYLLIDPQVPRRSLQKLSGIIPTHRLLLQY